MSVEIIDRQPSFSRLHRVELVVAQDALDLNAAEILGSIDDEKQVFLLRGTGFNMQSQIENLIEGLEKGFSTEELVQQCSEDVDGFYKEYLRRGWLFPIKVALAEEGLLATSYGKRLSETASSQEREGAALEGINLVEAYLSVLPSNTAVVMTSPPGWSGFEGIEYLDSQTYVYIKGQGGEVRAATLRNNMTLSQNEEFVGISGEGKTYRERIQDVVRTPTLFVGGEDRLEFLDVAKKIEDIAGRQTELVGEILKMDKVFENPVEIELRIEEMGRSLFEILSNNVDEEEIKSVAIEMGRAILDMSVIARGRASREIRYDYAAEHRHVMTLAGCNGGGATGPRLIKLTKNGELVYAKSCGVCGAPLNTFIYAGFSCPSCGENYLGIC